MTQECICHRESGSHELCCGYEDGRNPDCPQHGDLPPYENYDLVTVEK